MADMDTVILKNDDDEYISVTLGPRGHLYTNEQLMTMVRTAIASVESGEGREVDLTY